MTRWDLIIIIDGKMDTSSGCQPDMPFLWWYRHDFHLPRCCPFPFFLLEYL
jgi:hypothetical protein